MAELREGEAKGIEVDEVHLLEIDKSVHDWFNKTKPISFNGRKVPVMFGAWERFAQIQGNKSDKNLNELRDKNGKVRLPLISIRREGIQPNDTRYVDTDINGEPGLSFKRPIAHARFDKNRRIPFNKKWKVGQARYASQEPVYEVVHVPHPTFIDVNYNITFWSTYINQANEFHKKIWEEYKVKDIGYKGHFFYAHFTSSSDLSNLEDFSTEERIVRHSFELEVEAYCISKDDIRYSRTPSAFVFEEKVLDEFDGTAWDVYTNVTT